MASYSIEGRKKADGSIRYRCTVRVGGGKNVTYRESKTFAKKQHAKAWGTRRTAELEGQAAGGEQRSAPVPTVGALIEKYQNDPDLGGKAGRSKAYVLRMLADCDIAKIKADQLKEHHIVQHCRDRAEAGAGGVTVNGDVSYLRSVLKSARPVFGLNVDDSAIVAALPTLTRLNLIGKSQRRNRRPTSEEIDLLLEGLEKREKTAQGFIPFSDILRFSIFSCMRIGEVCKIRWEDLDRSRKSVLVRDRKDPRKKTGNHMVVPLLGDAWPIICKQAETDERIFPYNERSVTAGFQRVRNALNINDLRYHDLRREGASRLFEMGFSVEEVAQVTGHRDINILWKVYRELNPADLHKKYDMINS